jgi:hypothetical protein
LPVIAAGILCLIGGYLTVSSIYTGSEFLPRLNDRRPALSQSPVEIPRYGPQRLTRRVVLVIIDGMRWHDSYELPYLNRLRSAGIDAKATSHYPSFSRPNYVTIVTGVPPEHSGVRTNDYVWSVELDSIMDRARAEGLETGYVGDVSPGLPSMFSRPAGDGADPATGEWAEVISDARFAPWNGGFLNATRRLIDQRLPLVVLLPGAVDEAGHEEGADSDEYRDAAKLVDRQLETSLASIDLSRDTVIVVADHGHTDEGGHGGLEPEVMEVPLIMAGAGIRKGAAITDAQLIDVAPTVAALLGLPAPSHGLGRTLVGSLIITETAKQQLMNRDADRATRNEMIVSARKSAAKRAVYKRRIVRLPIVGGAFFLIAVLALWARRIGMLLIDWRVLLIALPAFPVTYYALLGIFGQQFSPSVIPARGSVVSELLTFGLLSTGVYVVASWFALRGRVILSTRLAAANGLAVCGLTTGLLPGALAWAWFTGPFAQVPGPTMMVLVPATYIAIACYSIATVVTLGLEIVVFFARAVDPRVRIARLEKATAREKERLRRESQS